MISRNEDLGSLEPALRHELGSRPDAVVWPRSTDAIPDDTLNFRCVYIPPDFVTDDPSELHDRLDHLLRFWGQTRRQYRNSIAFVIPDAAGQYASIKLPRKTESYGIRTEFQTLPIDHAPGLGLHDRVMRTLDPYLLDELAPDELARLLFLGESDCAGIHRVLFPAADIARWFFCFLSFPRVRNADPIFAAVRRGIRARRFGLLRESHLLEIDHLPPELESQVLFGVDLPPEDNHFDSGYLVWRGVLGRS